MMPVELAVSDATIWSINYAPRVLNYALRLLNYAPRVLIYAPRQYLKYRPHSWRSSYDNSNMFIVETIDRLYNRCLLRLFNCKLGCFSAKGQIFNWQCYTSFILMFRNRIMTDFFIHSIGLL
jgi:hypothetical protein